MNTPSTDVICKNCGSVNDYHIARKANNDVAYCNGCDKYIKNIPQRNAPMLHFGKYKGQFIKDIEDVSYLEWVRDKVKLSESTRFALLERIKSLLLTHR